MIVSLALGGIVAILLFDLCYKIGIVGSFEEEIVEIVPKKRRRLSLVYFFRKYGKG